MIFAEILDSTGAFIAAMAIIAFNPLAVPITPELFITGGAGVGQAGTPEGGTLKQQVPPAAEIAFTGIWFH
jgi:hypothetical protein